MATKSTKKVDWLREMREKEYDNARLAGKQPNSPKPQRDAKKSDPR